MKTIKFLVLLVLATSGTFLQASESVRSETSNPRLLDVLKGVKVQTGADFQLAPDLAGAGVSEQAMRLAQAGDVQSLLSGYNYELIHGRDGNISQILVTGRNGSSGSSGQSADTLEMTLLTIESAPVNLPAKFLRLNAGSVAAVKIDPVRLASMHKGEKLALSLPGGDYTVVHDNQFRHENGDLTWVGYVEGAGRGYRVIITSGKEGSLGQIVTPDGAYTLDLEDGRNWLVDISASGLQSGSLEGDAIEGEHGVHEHASLADSEMIAEQVPHYLEAKKVKKARVKKSKSSKQKTGSPANADVIQTTVDVMIVYTRGMNPKKVETRLNFLIATANQAYLDSEVPLQLRLVGSFASDYADKTPNNSALSDLTNGTGVFSEIAELRRQYGADLVTLIRPFDYASQKNCGSGWVNGARGSEMYSDLGYAVVSDGSDPTGWYCSDYTYAHELGHNMGSVHDASNSSFEGKFPFSYGHGAEGKFGTIMSYINPVVGVFSNPRLSCKGAPCGDAEWADNSRSLSLVASQVASFMPATH